MSGAPSALPPWSPKPEPLLTLWNVQLLQGLSEVLLMSWHYRFGVSRTPNPVSHTWSQQRGSGGWVDQRHLRDSSLINKGPPLPQLPVYLTVVLFFFN